MPCPVRNPATAVPGVIVAVGSLLVNVWYGIPRSVGCAGAAHPALSMRGTD
jgi:hypothetical protein